MADRFVWPALATGCRLSLPNPSVAFSDSSPFRGAMSTPCASPERGGVREADGGVHNRRIRELEPMVPEFVGRTRGSNRVQAQPARLERKN